MRESAKDYLLILLAAILFIGAIWLYYFASCETIKSLQFVQTPSRCIK